MPDCTSDTVPGARHVAPLQNPAEFVRRVCHHLLALRQRARPHEQQT